jgi:hypothetical protein
MARAPFVFIEAVEALVGRALIRPAFIAVNAESRQTFQNVEASSLPVIASEAKQSRGRSMTLWAPDAAHTAALGLLRRKGSSQ